MTKEIVEAALAELRRFPLGTYGYALPGIDQGELIDLTPHTKHASITVAATTTGRNFLWLEPQDRPIKIKVTIARGARDNLIVIGRNSQAHADFDIRGNNGLIVVGERNEWKAQFYARASSDRNLIFFGGASKCNGLRITAEGDDRTVIIGEDCMFANTTEIRTSDLHSVISMDDNSHINPAADVLLEPHVWLGQGSSVMKGVTVGFGSIIGAKAVVTKNVDRFTAVGGVPAREVKKGVSWDKELSPTPEKNRVLQEQCDKLASSARTSQMSGDPA
jgi:carbonic anhydrase/acetyltransferase-like protein (isoleucine patch superfamily)